MPNPHPVTAGNVNWRLAMLKAQFSKGRTNRRRCIAAKRDGTPCGMLAMTRHGLLVCGAHGEATPRSSLRMKRRRAMERCNPRRAEKVSRDRYAALFEGPSEAPVQNID